MALSKQYLLPHLHAVQLAKEILYDLKQADLAKQAARAAGAPTPAAHAAMAPAPGTACAAAGPAAAGAAGRGVATGGRRGRSPPPAGVVPGTPLAAEVLATAGRDRRQHKDAQQQQQQQQGGALPPLPPNGACKTPAARGAASGVKTPLPPATAARSIHGGAATPFTGASNKSRLGLGSSRRTPGGVNMLATPAPVSARKAATPGQAARFADENASGSGQAAGGAPLSQRRSMLLQKHPSPRALTTVTLPSPFREQVQRQWNIPEEVAQPVQKQARASRRGAAADAGTSTAAVAADSAAAGAAAATAAADRGGRAGRSSRGSTRAGKAAAAAPAPSTANNSGESSDDTQSEQSVGRAGRPRQQPASRRAAVAKHSEPAASEGARRSSRAARGKAAPAAGVAVEQPLATRAAGTRKRKNG